MMDTSLSLSLARFPILMVLKATDPQWCAQYR